MNRVKARKRRDRNAKYHIAIVLAAAAAMVAVGFIWFIHDGVNFQENYNIHLSLMHGLKLTGYGSNDDPMPLYFLLLHWFNAMFHGNYLFWDRILSLSAYALLIIVAYAIGRLAAERSFSGLIAALLIASSPFMIWYASRATVYSFLALGVAINLLAFVGLLKKRRWALFLYLPSLMIGLGLHFFFLAILVTQLGYILYRRRELGRSFFEIGLASLVLALAAFGYYYAISSVGSFSHWHYLPTTARPSTTNTFIIFFQYLFGFQSVVTTTLIISLWPLLVVLGLLAVQKYIRPPDAVKYLFLSATVPVIALFFSSWIKEPLFLSSYLIVCLPPFLIFLAWYLSAYKQKALSLARYGLIAGMLAMMVLELINWHLALSHDYLGLLFAHWF